MDPTGTEPDDDHAGFRDQVRRFARAELLEGYLTRSAGVAFPRAEHARMAAAGLLDLCRPEADGGQGADLTALGLACEEISYADPNCGYQLFSTNLLVGLAAGAGSPALREHAGPLAEGRRLGCFAVTEPSGGSDAAAMRTRATRTADGWRLTGEKTSITMAPHADLAVVLAQTEPGSGSRGIAAFLVPVDDPRVARQEFRDPGFRPLGRGSLIFDDLPVPDDHLLAPPGAGFGLVLREFDLSRTLIALLCVGAARRALDAAIAWSRERTAFGRPIAAHQGVSFPIAEHATYLAAVRALAHHTLRLRAAGRPHTTEAAMLKWWAPQVACAAIQESIVLHGQVGWSDELPLQALLRDVSGYQIGDGTPQIQKLIIARALIGRDVLDR